MSLERLWAGWRSPYLQSVTDGSPSADRDSAEGCLFCRLPAEDPDDALVVARNEHAYVVLNLYPYTSGHLLVVPNRHEANLEALPTDDAAALMQVTQRAIAAVKGAYGPDGINVGMNLGRSRGSGSPGAPARARGAALERRYQLHDHGGRSTRPARGAGGDPRSHSGLVGYGRTVSEPDAPNTA